MATGDVNRRGTAPHQASGGHRSSPALLLVAVVLSGCTSVPLTGGSVAHPASAPPSALAATPQVAASTAATTAASTSPPAPEWSVARTPAMTGSVSAPPVAIAAGPHAAVVVGERASLAPDRVFIDPPALQHSIATAFRSDDLVHWTPAVIDEGIRLGSEIPLSGPLVGMTAVAAGAGGFVATGIDLTPSVTGIAWHSTDGARWTRVELPGVATARPSAIAWNGSRYVVVGIDEAPVAPRMAVWTSPDGRTWRRIPDAPVFDVGGYLDTLEYHAWAGPTDVTASSDGALVAVGRTCTAGRMWEGTISCSAVVWRSPDGVHWDRMTQPGTLRGPIFAGAALGSRAVLVGASADRVGNIGGGQAVLAPADAASTERWRVIAIPEAPQLVDVAVLDGMLYAVGYEIQGWDVDSAADMVSLWRSADGTRWSRVEDLPAAPADVSGVRSAALSVAGHRLLVLVSVILDGAPGFVGIVLSRDFGP